MDRQLAKRRKRLVWTKKKIEEIEQEGWQRYRQMIGAEDPACPLCNDTFEIVDDGDLVGLCPRCGETGHGLSRVGDKKPRV